MSRTRRSAFNMAGVALGAATSAAASLIVTPRLVEALGSDRFGAFRVAVDSLSYLALIEWGIGGAVSAALAGALGRGDSDRVRTVLATSLRMFALIAACMTVAGALLIAIVPATADWGSVSRAEVAVALAIALIPIAWSPVSVFRALADAEQETYFVQGLIALQAVLAAALSLAAARWGWGLAGQSAALVCSQVPSALVLTVRALRGWPGVLQANPDPAVRSELWKLNFHGLAMSATSRFSLYSDNIILGWAAGPSAVAALFLTQRFVALAQGQLQGVGLSTWAGLAELHARGEREAFSERLVELTSMVSGFGAAMLVPLAVYNEWLIGLWTGPERYAGSAVSALACFNAWLLAVTGVWFWAIQGTGNIGKWLPWAFASTAINVAISVAGSKAWGAPGPLTGTAAALLSIQSWALPRMLQTLFGTSWRRICLAAIEPLVWAVPLGAALWATTHGREMPGAPMVALELAVALFAGLSSWWSVSLPAPLRLQWRGRFSLAFGRNGGAA